MNKLIISLIIILVIAVIAFIIFPAKKQFSVTGIITEINETSVKIDKRYTAMIDENTEFVYTEKPSISPEDVQTGEGPSILNKVEIDLSKLRIGDTVIASSNENIRSKFTAVKIEVLN